MKHHSLTLYPKRNRNHHSLVTDSVVQWIKDASMMTPIALESDDADIVRASQIQHAVEDIDRHVDFSHPTFVYT